MLTWLRRVSVLALTISFTPNAMLADDVHVAVVVLQPASANQIERSYLSKQSAPGAGHKLQVWVDSRERCTALLAAFRGRGDLAFDSPILAHLDGGEHKFPSPTQSWDWESVGDLNELDVVLLAEGAPELESVTKLVDAIHNAQVPPAIRRRQVAELRRTIDSLRARTSIGSDYSVKQQPESLGGLYRGMGCDWCRSAQKISLAPQATAIVSQRFP